MRTIIEWLAALASGAVAAVVVGTLTARGITQLTVSPIVAPPASGHGGATIPLASPHALFVIGMAALTAGLVVGEVMLVTLRVMSRPPGARAVGSMLRDAFTPGSDPNDPRRFTGAAVVAVLVIGLLGMPFIFAAGMWMAGR